MSDKKINLEKVIDSLGDNSYPHIEYVVDGITGNVDGSDDGLYQGLLQGKNLKELGIDEEVLNSENPRLELCRILLDKNATLFFKLGLTYREGTELSIDNDVHMELEEDNGGFEETGGYGIFLTNDGWDYGYFDVVLLRCDMPPKETYCHIEDVEGEEFSAILIDLIDNMDIYD